MRFPGWAVAGFWGFLALPAACGGDSRDNSVRTGGTGGSDRAGSGGAGARPAGGSSGAGGASGTDAGNTDGGTVTDAQLDAEGGTRCISPRELDDFVHQWADALCEGRAPCCTLSGLVLDQTNCTVIIPSELARDLISAECNRPSPDLSRMAECLEKTRAYGRLCEHDPALAEEARRACVFAFRGERGLGEPCNNDFDCADLAGSVVRCNEMTETGEQRRACQEMRYAKEGEACTFVSSAPVIYQCDPALGLYCHLTNTNTSVCFRYAPAGASCHDRQCDAESWCADELCVALRKPGESCRDDASACAQRSYCDIATGTCRSQKALGQACTDASECESTWCVSSKCAPATPWTPSAVCQ